MKSEGRENRPNMDLSFVHECDGGRELAEKLLDGSLEDMDDVLILLPTSRMCQELKLYIASSGGGLTGGIMTVQDLSISILDRYGFDLPIPPLTSRDLMVKRIMDKNGSPNFSHGKRVRSKMASTVSKVIGELLRESITPEDIEKVSRTSRSSELASIYADYISELEERRLLDNDLAPREALKLLRGSEESFSRVGIYLPGRMPSTHRALIDRVIGISDEVIIREHSSERGSWLSRGKKPVDDPEMDPRIPDPDEPLSMRLISERRYRSITGRDPMDVLRKTLRTIKRRIIEDGDDPSNFQIVFPYKQLFDDLLGLAADEYGLELDLGKDLPLEEVPVVSSIMTLLGSHSNGSGRMDVLYPLSTPFLSLMDPLDQPIRIEDLDLVTREAGIVAGMDDVKRNWLDPLDRLIADDGEQKSSFQRIIPPLRDLVMELSSLRKKARRPDAHFKKVIELLENLHVHSSLEELIIKNERDLDCDPGEGPYQINISGIREFYGSLSLISRVASYLGLEKMDFDTYLELLRMELGKRKVRSRTRGHGIRVMGIQEASGLSLGSVHLCCMVDGQLPPVAGGFKILTEGERLDLSIPALNDPGEYLKHLCRIISSSRESIFCNPMTDGSAELEPSRFIEDLQLEELDQDGSPMSNSELRRMIGELSDPSFYLYKDRSKAQGHDLPELISSTGECAPRIRRALLSSRSRSSTDPGPYTGRLVDESSIALLRKRYGPDHVWSVSQLETYRKCSYTFFARYILDIREREDLDPGIPPEKKGLIFHEVAERFYRNWAAQGFDRIDGSTISRGWSLMMRITDDVMSRYNYRGPFWDALRDQLLGKDGEKGLLLEFLEMEASYDGPFSVHRTELSFGMGKGEHPHPASVSLPGQEMGPDSFLLRGSIDRVDLLRSPGGDLSFIWDYKTGGSDVDKDSLQVPLYLAAMRKVEPKVFPSGGGYFYVRKRGDIRRDPVMGEGIWSGETTGKEALQSHIQEMDARIASSIEESLQNIDSLRSGDLSFDPKCRSKRCPYMGMCRRGDRI